MSDPELPPDMVNRCSLGEALGSERQLVLKQEANFTRSTAKDAGKLISSLYCFNKYMTSPALQDPNLTENGVLQPYIKNLKKFIKKFTY